MDLCFSEKVECCPFATRSTWAGETCSEGRCAACRGVSHSSPRLRPLPPHLPLYPAVSSSPGPRLRGGRSWLTTRLTKCTEDFSSLREIVSFHASVLPLLSLLTNHDDQNFEHVFERAPVLGVPVAPSSIRPLITRLLGQGVDWVASPLKHPWTTLSRVSTSSGAAPWGRRCPGPLGATLWASTAWSQPPSQP